MENSLLSSWVDLPAVAEGGAEYGAGWGGGIDVAMLRDCL